MQLMGLKFLSVIRCRSHPPFRTALVFQDRPLPHYRETPGQTSDIRKRFQEQRISVNISLSQCFDRHCDQEPQLTLESSLFPALIATSTPSAAGCHDAIDPIRVHLLTHSQKRGSVGRHVREGREKAGIRFVLNAVPKVGLIDRISFGPPRLAP